MSDADPSKKLADALDAARAMSVKRTADFNELDTHVEKLKKSNNPLAGAPLEKLNTRRAELLRESTNAQNLVAQLELALTDARGATAELTQLRAAHADVEAKLKSAAADADAKAKAAAADADAKAKAAAAELDAKIKTITSEAEAKADVKVRDIRLLAVRREQELNGLVQKRDRDLAELIASTNEEKRVLTRDAAAMRAQAEKVEADAMVALAGRANEISSMRDAHAIEMSSLKSEHAAATAGHATVSAENESLKTAHAAVAAELAATKSEAGAWMSEKTALQAEVASLKELVELLTEAHSISSPPSMVMSEAMSDAWASAADQISAPPHAPPILAPPSEIADETNDAIALPGARGPATEAPVFDLPPPTKPAIEALTSANGASTADSLPPPPPPMLTSSTGQPLSIPLWLPPPPGLGPPPPLAVQPMPKATVREVDDAAAPPETRVRARPTLAGVEFTSADDKRLAGAITTVATSIAEIAARTNTDVAIACERIWEFVSLGFVEVE